MYQVEKEERVHLKTHSESRFDREEAGSEEDEEIGVAIDEEALPGTDEELRIERIEGERFEKDLEVLVGLDENLQSDIVEEV